jgi:hypothetical protein
MQTSFAIDSHWISSAVVNFLLRQLNIQTDTPIKAKREIMKGIVHPSENNTGKSF